MTENEIIAEIVELAGRLRAAAPRERSAALRRWDARSRQGKSPEQQVFADVLLTLERSARGALLKPPAGPLPTPETARRGGELFVSYCHRDEPPWLDHFRIHLSPFLRRGDLRTWHDRHIEPGEEWRAEIDAALERATTALLLVTSKYLASDFIMDHELPLILSASRRDKEPLTLLWIAVSASNYQVTAIEKLQALNDPKRPLDTLAAPVLQQELVGICRGIAATVG